MFNSYRHTVRASYIGYITGATINNFAPLLFLTFQDLYGIDIGRIAMLVGVNFGVQLLMNFLGANFADKIGYRKIAVTAHIFAATGLVGLGVLPEILSDAYVGLMLAVLLYGFGGGMLEVVISPIVEACPEEPGKKSARMSFLHSFYCWGQVSVIVIATVFFIAFGIENWKILACILAVVPAANAVYFTRVPILQLNQGGESMSVRKLAKLRLFWVLLLLMVCAGASEQAMVQWASFFAESGLGVPKAVGDLAGPGMFAVLMGISRVFYAKFSERINLQKFIIASGCLCVVTYIVASLSPVPVIGLIASALTGLSVGIMWPGMLSVASVKCKNGGTALFALLALGGTLGCTIGPLAVGFVAEAAGDNIRAGISVGTVFPLILAFGAVLLLRHGKNVKEN